VGEIGSPEPLSAAHDLSDFDCGHPTLNTWLQRHALSNQDNGASRTFVVCDAHRKVLGYYALATGSVDHTNAHRSVRRNMPDPVPVMILGRLAVDVRVQRGGFGKGLLKDAILRTLTVAQQAGIRALLVHAISQEAHDYYVRCGFHESPVNHMTLMITLEEARRHLGD